MASEKDITTKIVRESHLDFLFEMHQRGVEIGPENVELLRKHKYLSDIPKEVRQKAVREAVLKLPIRTSEKSKQADSLIDITEEEHLPEKPLDILTSDELEERRKRYGHKFIGRSTPILSHEWRPESTTEHTQEFIDWINSINKKGFRNRIQFKPFTLYCQQAYQWLAESASYTDFEDEDERLQFMMEELRRCDENALYFLNKYVFYKEGDDETGKIKYIAAPAHEFLAYLDDAGYSVGLAKGRQMAATTTLMALDVRDVIFKTNHFMKFITEDVIKAEEIIEDKLKFCFAELPWWMTPDVLNERDGMFKMGFKKDKGRKEGVGSKIQISAPKRTAIAGGAPQKVKIDEAGNIPILGVMIGNARPTMMYFDPKTRKLKLKRRLWFYGCVCAGTKVWDSYGNLVNIEDISQEHGIIGYDGIGISQEPILRMAPPAKKLCFKITTEGGDTIECSYDHPILWGRNDWKTSYNKKRFTFKRACEIRVGDQLGIIDEMPMFGTRNIKEARLLGLMIGDGNYSLNNTPQLSVADDEIRKYVSSNWKESKVYKTKKCKHIEKYHEAIGLKGFFAVLKKHGIYGQVKDHKRLPKDVDFFSKKSLSELLAGIFDADGNVCFDNKEKIARIVLTATNKTLLNEIKFQLVKFGIHCSVLKENRGVNDKKISSGQKNYIYRLYINNQGDVLRFKKNIKLLCKHKTDNLKKCKVSKVFNTVRDGQFVTDFNNGKGAFFNNKKDLNGIRFKRVFSVEQIGEKETYNLTAGKTNTYLANNFITANTGGEMEKGGKAFETELMTIMRQWDEGNYDAAIVPIFLDWTCRPGATQEDYDREKRMAYAKGDNPQDPDAKRHITEFHQTWPTTLSDVFRTSAKTLVDEDYIESALERIRTLKAQSKVEFHQSGYFEPIFDYNSPTIEGSDADYKIIGSTFVPTTDISPRATVTIFMHPERGWENRYWQGTDPIDTDTGLSNMASTIWDKMHKAPIAILNWRTRDYREVFMQTLLLGMYYDTKEIKKCIPELLEANRGTSYTEYKKNKGYGDSLVLNFQLPINFQNKTTINDSVGIDNKGIRNTMIVNCMHDLIELYGDRIMLEIFFQQLKTFTCKISDHGKEVWGVVNKRYFKDDTLFGTTFAYICSELCFPDKQPKNIVELQSKYEVKYKLQRGPDNKLRRVQVRVPVAA